MKTRNFIPTLLALIIRVMVSGQTPANQAPYRTLNVLGGGNQPSSPSTGVAKKQALKEKSEAVQKDQPVKHSTSKKIYPTLMSSEGIAVQSKPGAAVKTQVTVIDNNTFNYYSNASCYSTMVYARELLKQADELAVIEQELRSEAAGKKGDEKLKLVKAAAELLKQAEIKQIQASEISGKISLETFNRNESVFNTLLVKTTNETIITEAVSLNGEAVYSIKIAREMREEAYSYTGNSAKLGTLNNAEEKETIALNRQDAAINLLKRSTAANNIPAFNDLAVR